MELRSQSVGMLLPVKAQQPLRLGWSRPEPQLLLTLPPEASLPVALLPLAESRSVEELQAVPGRVRLVLASLAVVKPLRALAVESDLASDALLRAAVFAASPAGGPVASEPLLQGLAPGAASGLV